MTSNQDKEMIAEMFSDMRTAKIRTFDTGATRSPMADKLCYSGFFSPKVMKRVAEYMHLHRKQADGNIREADNWKKGIPVASYLDSMTRHFMDVWMHLDGCGELATEDLQTALCGLFFNTQGMLFEELGGKDVS
jgi:hypothetical protein